MARKTDGALTGTEIRCFCLGALAAIICCVPTVTAAQICADVNALLLQGFAAGQIARATGLSHANIRACASQSRGIVVPPPAGPPPLGAAGPAPLGAAGPPPVGAAGPPPIGAAGPAPGGVAR